MLQILTDECVNSEESADNNDNETKDWKVYNNTKYYFRIKYPKELSKINEYDNFIDIIPIKLMIVSGTSVKSAVESYFWESDEGSTLPLETYKITDTVIANKKASQISFDTDVSGERETLLMDCVENDGKIYMIFVMDTLGDYSYKTFHDLVISTFKFINSCYARFLHIPLNKPFLFCYKYSCVRYFLA